MYSEVPIGSANQFGGIAYVDVPSLMNALTQQIPFQPEISSVQFSLIVQNVDTTTEVFIVTNVMISSLKVFSDGFNSVEVVRSLNLIYITIEMIEI